MNIIWLLIKLCALVIQERIKGVPASYFYTINLILKPTLVCTAISLSILLVYFWCICFSNDSYSHFWSLFPGDWSFIDTIKRQFKKFIFILLLVLVLICLTAVAPLSSPAFVIGCVNATFPLLKIFWNLSRCIYSANMSDRQIWKLLLSFLKYLTQHCLIFPK